MSNLSERIHTFGHAMLERHGERVHKIALDAGFTCPNRDGSKGIGGCTFCNNKSFAPARATRRRLPRSSTARAAASRGAPARSASSPISRPTPTPMPHVDELRALYDEALAAPDVIGLSIGTRPDCVPPPVLDLLAEYRERGHEVWLELGLQSAFDDTLERVNRGHGFAEYRDGDPGGAGARHSGVLPSHRRPAGRGRIP